MLRSFILAGVIALMSVALPVSAAPDQEEVHRETYLEQAEQKLEKWSADLQHFAKTAKEETTSAATAAREELDRAWTVVRQRWSELRRETGKHWDAGRQRFDDALADLDKAWKRVNDQEQGAAEQ